jgi:hypothetical protein
MDPLARRAPTIKRWPLDAHSGGSMGTCLGIEEQRELSIKHVGQTLLVGGA